jgi:hypothetical protein
MGLPTPAQKPRGAAISTRSGGETALGVGAVAVVMAASISSAAPIPQTPDPADCPNAPGWLERAARRGSAPSCRKDAMSLDDTIFGRFF